MDITKRVRLLVALFVVVIVVALVVAIGPTSGNVVLAPGAAARPSPAPQVW